MRITVNDQPRETADGATLAALLASLSLDAGRVAVERNGDLVPRASFASLPLAEGDRLVIVHFVGGG